jgi:CubicO group peptidase (beta-lactamase class C family)
MATRRRVLASGLAVGAGALIGAPGAGASPEAFAKAAAYSEANGGNAMLVEQGGKILFESAPVGQSVTTPNFLASATKSFWGPTAAAMIEDGLITSFDERAADTLTEWTSDARKRTITLRQLLSLTSGLHNDIAAIQGEGTARDKYLYAINASLDDDPGAAFTYGPVNFYVFGEIAKRKLKGRGQNPLDYLRARILEPIGLTYGDWIHDEAGNPHIPNGAYVSAREWVKFGRLVLNKGQHDGRQILRSDLLGECFRPNAVNPGYGLTWWLNMPGGRANAPGRAAPPGTKGGFIYAAGHPDLAGAMGAGPNNLYLLPSLDMVVIRQCPASLRPSDISWEEQRRRIGQARGSFADNVFLSLLLTGKAP